MYDGNRPEGGVGNGEQRRIPFDTARSKGSTPEERLKFIDETVPSPFKYTRYCAVGLSDPLREGAGNETPG